MGALDKNDELLTMEEVGQVLRAGTKKLWQLRKTGDLSPVITIGRRNFMRRRDVAEYLKRHEKNTSAGRAIADAHVAAALSGT